MTAYAPAVACDRFRFCECARQVPEAIRVATEFMELHRKHWPGFQGESEVRLMFESDTDA